MWKKSCILLAIIAVFGSVTLLISPASAKASPQLASGQETGITYTVQPGDSLHAISLRFRSSIQAIVKANGIQNPNLIWPGQALAIPAGPSDAQPVSSVAGSQLDTKIAKAPNQQDGASSVAVLDSVSAPMPVLMDQQETAMLEGINAQRAAAGLPRIRFEPSLMPIARARSNDMATRGYFSHTTPEGIRVQDLARAAGLNQAVISEILARNNYPADKSVEVSITAFMKSENHRAHILSSIYVGAAVAEARTPQGMQYYTVVLSGDQF